MMAWWLMAKIMGHRQEKWQLACRGEHANTVDDSGGRGDIMFTLSLWAFNSQHSVQQQV